MAWRGTDRSVLRAWLLACTSAAACAATAAETPAALPHVALAPGAYVVPGQQAAWGPGHDHVANLGFVIGTRCIAIIDSGGSPTVGRGLLAAVREHSALPICWVVNTHAHPDHVMGNSALADANGAQQPAPVFVGHHRLRPSLAARAPFYLNTMRRDFAAADQATTVPPPTLAVQDTMELDLGERVLELRAWPTAHTDADLTVRDRQSDTLWLGDLAFVGHLPVVDGKLGGWLKVLQQLRAAPARQMVPGHGAVQRQGAAAFDATLSYLKDLDRDVRAALDQGLTLSQTVDKLGAVAPAAPGAADPWLLVDQFHRRNITAAFAELEWTQ
jgi:quinoprotein relay system zinc metallohydrolase 2